MRSGEVDLAVRETGPAGGPPVVLLHGLATNREYVLMRSSKLERSGYRVIAYDARGHGRSSAPAGPDAYEYDLLLGDLLAVLDARGVERALLVGVSMGAHTALKAALTVPERVHTLVAITPAYGIDRDLHRKSIASADRLAAALRSDGVEGFVATFEYPPASENLTEAFRTAQRRQLSQHASLDSVADALEVVMRAKPYALDELAAVRAPTLIVASRDEYDTEHPYATAERYVQLIPGARLVCEEPGRKPLAWNGGALAKHVLALAEETGW